MNEEQIELLKKCADNSEWAKLHIENLVRMLNYAKQDCSRLEEELAKYKNLYRASCDEIEEWKISSGLMDSAGDPDGITPETAQKYWESIEKDLAFYKKENSIWQEVVKTSCDQIAKQSIEIAKIFSKACVDDKITKDQWEAVMSTNWELYQ